MGCKGLAFREPLIIPTFPNVEMDPGFVGGPCLDPFRGPGQKCLFDSM